MKIRHISMAAIAALMIGKILGIDRGIIEIRLTVVEQAVLENLLILRRHVRPRVRHILDHLRVLRRVVQDRDRAVVLRREIGRVDFQKR